MNKYNENIPTGDTNNYVEGLYVKDGRLINGRPNGINGIEKAAALKNMIDRTKKINMIADAIELSQARKELVKTARNEKEEKESENQGQQSLGTRADVKTEVRQSGWPYEAEQTQTEDRRSGWPYEAEQTHPQRPEPGFVI